MCHIGCPGHGKRFKAKLRQLSEHGEDWALEEIQQYNDAVTFNQLMADLRKQLDSLADIRPRLKFSQVVRYCAAASGMSYSELTKRASWMRAAWKKACAEADRIVART
jgi:hypothetical protein